MNDFGWLASTWLLRTLAAGGALLLLAWLALQFIRDPARRQRLAAWTFRGAVLAAILGFFPAWLTIPISLGEAPPAETAKIPLEPRVDAIPAMIVPEAPLVWEDAPPEMMIENAAEPEPLPLAVTPPVIAEAPAESRACYPWLLGAYGAIALLAATQLLIALIGLIRLRRSSSPAPDHIVKLATVLAAPIGAMPQVRISTRIASPVCFGWFRPTVLLPEALLKTARAGEIRWVLVHELDHLRRGDPRTGLWVGLARVLYFVVPWFWAVRRELRLAQEYLADAAAAAGRPADYAAFLVSLSGTPSRRAPLGAVAVRAGRTDLYRRVSMLTQASPVRDGCSRGWSILTAGGVLAAAVAFSGIGFADDDKPKPRVVEVEVPDAPKPKMADEARPVQGTVTIQLAGNDEIQKITKSLNEALENGKIDEAKKLAAKLSEVLKARQMVIVGDARGSFLQLPEGTGSVARGAVWMHRESAAREAEAVRKMEEKLESLKKALENVKDSPEAREALEKTITEFKKKIEEARKNGELNGKDAAPTARNEQQNQQEQKRLQEFIEAREKLLTEYRSQIRAIELKLKEAKGKDADAEKIREELKLLQLAQDQNLKKQQEDVQRLNEAQAAARLATLPPVQQRERNFRFEALVDPRAQQGQWEAAEANEKKAIAKMVEFLEARLKTLEAQHAAAKETKPEILGILKAEMDETRGRLEAAKKQGQFLESALKAAAANQLQAWQAGVKENQAKVQAQLDLAAAKLKKLEGELADEAAWRADKGKMEVLKAQVEQAKAEVELAKAQRALAEQQAARGRVTAVQVAPDARVAEADRLTRQRMYVCSLPAEGRFGVSIDPVPAVLAEQLGLPEGKGMVVTAVAKKSPAELAGVKPNDILLEIAGKPVTGSAEDVAKLVGGIKAGEKFSVTVLRKGKKETLEGAVIPAAKAEKNDEDKPGEKKINFSSMNVTVTNGNFTIDAKNDEGTYYIVGTLEDGKPVAKSIDITHGDWHDVYKMKNVPKADRAAVEQLLRSIGGSSR